MRLDWKQNNDKLKNLQDPFDKIIFDAHCYFDENHSGTYAKKEKINQHTGINRVAPFIQWLQKHKKRGIIGEFGVPDSDKKWLTELDDFMQYLSRYRIDWNYWAAGQWWHEYPLSIEPVGGADRPQLLVLQKYLTPPGSNAIPDNGPGKTVAAPGR